MTLENTDEVSLIASNIDDVTKIELVSNKVPFRTLNLHGNRIGSLAGLEIFMFKHLVDLNLSSNKLLSCDLPELSYMPFLESLDLSANFIENVCGLPFIPTLQTLLLSFNQIRHVAEIQVSLPSLKHLDIRCNVISSLKDLSSLFGSLVLKQIDLDDGSNTNISNPLCRNVVEVMQLFDNIPNLEFIDGKDVNWWNQREDSVAIEMANSMKAAIANNAYTISSNRLNQKPVGDSLSVVQSKMEQQIKNNSIVRTPKFDLLSKRFKLVAQSQDLLPGDIHNSVIRRKINEFVARNLPSKNVLSAEDSSAIVLPIEVSDIDSMGNISPSDSVVVSNQEKLISTNDSLSLHQTQFINLAETLISTHESVTTDEIGSVSPTAVIEKRQSNDHNDNTRHIQEADSSSQKKMAAKQLLTLFDKHGTRRFNESNDMHRIRRLNDHLLMINAFQKMYSIATFQHISQQNEKLCLSAEAEKTSQLKQYETEINELRLSHRRDILQSKCKTDIMISKLVELESMNRKCHHDVDVITIKHQQHQQEQEQVLNQLQLQIQERKDANDALNQDLLEMTNQYEQLQEQFEKSKNEFDRLTLVERDNYERLTQNLSDQNNAIQAESRRVDEMLENHKVVIHTRDEEIGNLNKLVQQLQTEKDELLGKVSKLRRRVHDVSETTQLTNLNKIQLELEQLRNDRTNSQTELLDSLKRDVEKYKQKSDKRRIVLEEMSLLIERQKVALDDSKRRESALLRELEGKSYWPIDRACQTDTQPYPFLLHGYMNQSDLAYNSFVNEPNTTVSTIQHERDFQAMIKENEMLRSLVDGLQSQLQLHQLNIVKQTSAKSVPTSPSSSPLISSPSSDTTDKATKQLVAVSELKNHLKIKDKILDDQNKLIHDLREKISQYDQQNKLLNRDLKDSESLLDEAKADIADLEQQLQAKVEIEQNLNELILQFQNDKFHIARQHRHSVDSSTDRFSNTNDLNAIDDFDVFREDIAAKINQYSLPPKPKSLNAVKVIESLYPVNNAEKYLSPSQPEHANVVTRNTAISVTELQKQLSELTERKDAELLALQLKLNEFESELTAVTASLDEEKIRHQVDFENAKSEKKKLLKIQKRLEHEKTVKDEDITRMRLAITQLKQAFLVSV